MMSNSIIGTLSHIGRALQKVSSGMRGQRRPRSACASAQADQGLRCLLTESLDTIESFNRKNTMPELDCACAGCCESAHFPQARRYIFA